MRIVLSTFVVWMLAAAATCLASGTDSLSAKDLGKNVTVHTNLSGMASTGPLPPDGMDTMTKEGLVMRGRLDGFEGDYLTVSMGYPNSTPDNRKSATILKKAVTEIEVAK